MISYISLTCSRYSTLTAIFSITVLLPTLFQLYHFESAHSTHHVFSRHISLSPHWYSMIFASVFLLPEPFLHVHLKSAILKPSDVVSSVYLKYFSIKSSTDLFFKQIRHVRCCTTVCCVLLWFRSHMITDIINISFIILCAGDYNHLFLESLCSAYSVPQTALSSDRYFWLLKIVFMKYHNIKLWKIKWFSFSIIKWYSKNHVFSFWRQL